MENHCRRSTARSTSISGSLPRRTRCPSVVSRSPSARHSRCAARGFVPELRLEPLEQTYTREAERVFRYRATVDAEPFVARLDTDAFGRVLRYEGLWEAVSAVPADGDGGGTAPA